MRLVIDLQGAQGESRARGIGRMSRELALAMARTPGPHEPIVLLNDAMPDAAEALSDRFAQLLPRANVRSWRGMTGCGWLGGSAERRRATELARAQVLCGLEPDLVHVSSMMEGLSDDVVAAWPLTHRRMPTAATFYDAIPLLRPADYLNDTGKKDFYFRHVHELQACAALLAISQSSRSEAVVQLGCDPSAVHTIGAGFDAARFRPVVLETAARQALLARYGLRDGYVLFVGAGDPRKNDLGLLRGYARLPARLRAAHQLVIVGSADPARLRAEAAGTGVAPDDLALPRHVAEADLPSLYSLCRCFALPSEHEGFGLPALEAMACGAAVIASDRTSLPEVVGCDEALFDPYDPADIAARIERVLTDAAFHDRLAEHGRTQSARFGWDISAARAWRALEEAAPRTIGPKRGGVAARKPSLAFVGPLPPDASGIAEYGRDLLPSLARHYDITVVTRSGVVDDPMCRALFAVLDEDQFDAVARRFDRIVYQAGNSEFHVGILDRLLPRHPGVVMMHDAFLSGVPLYVAVRAGDIGHLARALFDSHGWPAVKLLAEEGIWPAVLRYPCQLPVFRAAIGVLQHSEHARAIVAHEVGGAAAAEVRIVSFARASWPPVDRGAARAALGLGPGTPVVCSFGIVANTKRPADVLDAWHAGLADDPAARLVFVGHAVPDTGAEVMARAAELGVADRVVVTGRVSEAAYRQWLAAADLAVQLRTLSRGETSAAIADCLAAGLPIVANAHGSAAELPQEALLLLPDSADTTAIAAAIRTLWRDPGRRAALSACAAAHARTDMAPDRVATQYREAIEDFYGRGEAGRLRGAMPALPREDWPEAARMLAASFARPGPGQLLLTAGGMDAESGAGSRRAGRQLGRRILLTPSSIAIADLVRFDGATLRHAPRSASELLGLDHQGLVDRPAMTGRGDTIVLLDNEADIGASELAELRRLRRQGARVIAVVGDLLPLLHPQWFSAAALPRRQGWLRSMLGLCDAALCVSRAVADELAAWLADHSAEIGRERPLAIDWFHLGADLDATGEPDPADADVAAVLASMAQRPTFLMVGTVEPRKGHEQALGAMERLWTSGVEAGLVVAGRPGWMTDRVQARLRAHSEQGGRVHWLQAAPDAALARLYGAACSLLMASEGEGFGLPLVEAGRAGLPIVARDLPVFRELAGDDASWFHGLSPDCLAQCLTSSLGRRAGAIPTLTWDESAARLLERLAAAEPYRTWTPPDHAG